MPGQRDKSVNSLPLMVFRSAVSNWQPPAQSSINTQRDACGDNLCHSRFDVLRPKCLIWHCSFDPIAEIVVCATHKYHW